jgi:hypothetical protein
MRALLDKPITFLSSSGQNQTRIDAPAKAHNACIGQRKIITTCFIHAQDEIG